VVHVLKRPNQFCQEAFEKDPSWLAPP